MALHAPTALAGLAGVLAVGALVVRDPPTARRASVDLVALANEVERGADHMSAEELHALAQGNGPKLRIVDLRAPEEFAAGHVPGAENVPLSQIHTLKARLDEPILLYSGGGIHSSQAWYLLRARGLRDVRFLIGGYDEWLRLTAPPAAAPAPQQAAAVPAPGPTNELATPPPAATTAAGDATKSKARRQRRDEARPVTAAPPPAPPTAPATAATTTNAAPSPASPAAPAAPATKVREGC